MNSQLAQMLFLLSLVFALGASPSVATAEPTSLRVVTFNVEIFTAPGVRASQLQKFRFDHARRLHLERVADVIETLNPDILNLVEATSREVIDGIVAILHEKGMTDYRGYHIESNDTFTGMDVGVITRYPLDEVEGSTMRTIYSERDDPTWRQSFQLIEEGKSPRNLTTSITRNSLYFVTIGKHRLGMFGIHLKSNPSDNYSNAKRSAQAELVRRAIRSEIVRRGYQPIVLGDFNDYDPDVPDRDRSRDTSTSVMRDIKDYDPDRQGPELINVASKIIRQDDRYSSHWDWNENGARDGEDVLTMIDHILIPKEMAPSIERAFISRIVSLHTSDHFPVVVDLKLP